VAGELQAQSPDFKYEGPMPTVLITGCDRGLGLEFARQYAAAGCRVYATCLDPAAAEAVTRLQGLID
jgi:NAD(P)-dependent dehydrogenase (short-subunit alcohol dehydrogenase family)